METSFTPWKIIEDVTKYFKNIEIQSLVDKEELPHELQRYVPIENFSKNSLVFYISIIKIISSIIDYYFFSKSMHILEENCPICHENLSEDTLIITICCHKYHKNCLNEWVMYKKNCPICRHEL